MQFQVPQFIETEDKIAGPFSLKQFVFLGGIALVCFLLFYVLQSMFLAAVLSLILAGGGVALAFVKVNGKGLPSILGSALRFYWKPQTYVWQAENPSIRKEEVIESSGLQSIVSGVLLKNAWQNLQTGTKTVTGTAVRKTQERYQIFQKITGERKAARRVDYR